MNAATANLLLILAGGPASIAVPILVARTLVWRHADQTAEAIRAAYYTEKPAARPAVHLRLPEQHSSTTPTRELVV